MNQVSLQQQQSQMNQVSPHMSNMSMGQNVYNPSTQVPIQSVFQNMLNLSQQVPQIPIVQNTSYNQGVQNQNYVTGYQHQKSVSYNKPQRGGRGGHPKRTNYRNPKADLYEKPRDNKRVPRESDQKRGKRRSPPSRKPSPKREPKKKYVFTACTHMVTTKYRDYLSLKDHHRKLWISQDFCKMISWWPETIPIDNPFSLEQNVKFFFMRQQVTRSSRNS